MFYTVLPLQEINAGDIEYQMRRTKEAIVWSINDLPKIAKGRSTMITKVKAY